MAEHVAWVICTIHGTISGCSFFCSGHCYIAPSGLSPTIVGSGKPVTLLGTFSPWFPDPTGVKAAFCIPVSLT